MRRSAIILFFCLVLGLFAVASRGEDNNESPATRLAQLPHWSLSRSIWGYPRRKLGRSPDSPLGAHLYLGPRL